MSNHTNEITLQVNGESRTCPDHTYLPQLLENLGLNPRLVAVEYNGEILHRQFWSQTQIKEGDKLEIVTIVGGGMRDDIVSGDIVLLSSPPNGCGHQ